jgi:putative lipoprotein
MRALILIALLAACSQQTQTAETPATETATPAEPSSTQAALAQMPQWDGARAAGVDFRGVGQEPGWMLDIYTQERIRVLWNYGENIADFPLSAPNTSQEGATRYETQADGHTLAVTIRRFPCEDAMSGEAYPSSVEIVIDGTTLNGCGRSV